jgi:hypothetical protein
VYGCVSKPSEACETRLLICAPMLGRERETTLRGRQGWRSASTVVHLNGGTGATNRTPLYHTARLRSIIGLPKAALPRNSRDWLASSHTSYICESAANADQASDAAAVKE